MHAKSLQMLASIGIARKRDRLDAQIDIIANKLILLDRYLIRKNIVTPTECLTKVLSKVHIYHIALQPPVSSPACRTDNSM